MSKRKYFIILILAITAMLCMVGASTWIVTSPSTLTPTWDKGKSPLWVKRYAEFDYNEKSEIDLAIDLISKLEFCDENGPVNISTAVESVNSSNVSATNGDITVENKKITVGSTYRVDGISIQLKDDYQLVGTYTTDSNIKDTIVYYTDRGSSNYQLDGLLLKYKTVQISNTLDPNGSWYTIEDAINLAGSSTIVVAGSDTSTNVETAFTSLGKEFTGYNYTESNGHMVYDIKGKIRVPFANVDMDYHGSGGLTEVSGKSNGCDKIAVNSIDKVYSALSINKNIELNITQNASLIVGGLIAGSGGVKNRGVVMNEGTITVKSGGTVGAYGYIKDGSTDTIGKIVFESGSMGVDVFRLYDWRGGARSAGYNTANLFPVNAYSAHNISCEAVFYAGCLYEAFWTIQFNNALYKGFQRGDITDNGSPKDGNVKLIGRQGDSAMFILTSGYIIKTTDGGSEYSNIGHDAANKALKTLTGSNQSQGQRDIYKMYGEVKDGTVSLSITASGTRFNMKTSTNMALPVSYMNVVAANDGNGNVGKVTLQNASYKFLPGTSITIDERATVNIAGESTLYLYTYSDCYKEGSQEGVNDGVIDASILNDNPFIKNYKGKTDSSGDAFIEINGTLIIGSSAKFGGKVISTSIKDNSQLIMNGAAEATVKYANKVSEGVLTDTITPTDRTSPAHGILDKGNGNSEDGNFTQGTWLYTNGAWKQADTSNSITVHVQYDAGDGTFADGQHTHTEDLTMFVENVSEGGTIDYALAPGETPSLPFYSVDYWYYLEGDTKYKLEERPFSVHNNDTLHLYADWTPIDYAVTLIVQPAGMTAEQIAATLGTETPLIEIIEGSWNIEASSSLNSYIERMKTLLSAYDNTFVLGTDVYLAADLTNLDGLQAITELSKDTLAGADLSSQYGIILVCRATQTLTFNVVYDYSGIPDDTDHKFETAGLNDRLVENFNGTFGDLIPKTNFGYYDYNTSKEYYFAGWYVKGAKIEMNTAVAFEHLTQVEGNYTLTLVAKWEKKASISIRLKDEYTTQAFQNGKITCVITVGGDQVYENTSSDNVLETTIYLFDTQLNEWEIKISFSGGTIGHGDEVYDSNNYSLEATTSYKIEGTLTSRLLALHWEASTDLPKRP